MIKKSTKKSISIKKIKKDKKSIEEITQEIFEGPVDPKRVILLKERLQNLQANIDLLLKILDKDYKITGDDYITETFSFQNLESWYDSENAAKEEKNTKNRIVEGVFDGENMVAADGKRYSVPPNYASKSKLVEGDILKLTITPSGAFKFKQIGPIERRRIVGRLIQDEHTMQFFADFKGKKWKVLTSSVSYFQGEPCDEIVFVIPKDSVSRWAAVENIIKEGERNYDQQFYNEGLEELSSDELENISASEIDIVMDEFEEGLRILDACMRGEI